MAATFQTMRRCPYCGEDIRLADCPIVATNLDLAAAFVVDVGSHNRMPQLPSGTLPIRMLPSDFPVVLESPNSRTDNEPTGGSSYIRDVLAAASSSGNGRSSDKTLPSVTADGARPEDLPARACCECGHPLPAEIDDRQAVVIAVVGVNRVGKTHLLAASLAEGYFQNGLEPIDCVEFVPSDGSSARFRNDYYKPLFRDRQLLDRTQMRSDVSFNPLTFNVTLEGREPFSLILHDIAGESLGDVGQRAATARYLRAARGILFVADPREIESLRKTMPLSVIDDPDNDVGFDQGALLAACLLQHGDAGDGRIVPLAVAIAKGDLLEENGQSEILMPPTPSPDSEGSEEWLARIRSSSEAVRNALKEWKAFDLLAPAEAHEARCDAARSQTDDPGRVGAVTFHVVSALGEAPDEDGELKHVAPRNCLDPLAAIIAQIHP